MRIVFASLVAGLAAPCLAAAQAAPPERDKIQDAYFQAGQASLDAALARHPNLGKARNVILFIGDGMGVNSVTAGRILAGQRLGQDGASHQLTFETLPYVGLSKTFSADNLVSDSANGISAITTGVKTINGAVGVDASVRGKVCEGVAAARVSTIAELAKRSGRSAGVVTTAGVTDATPAGAFGHTSTRQWRSDSELTTEAVAAGCIDLARQLVEAKAELRMDVAFGGDLKRFLPQGDLRGGVRQDGRDLVTKWSRQAPAARFVANAAALDALDIRTAGPTLGLFAPDDLPSSLEPRADVPSLALMTSKAIDLLSRNPNGYFLLVESASIDKWHHKNRPYHALAEVDELSKAVEAALAKTDPRETLIIVTADHSHGLVLSGYAPRGADLMGLATDAGGAPLKDALGRTYPLLSYATGPGATGATDSSRRVDDLAPARVPLTSATHGGEDVPVYASGPQAYLLTSTFGSQFIYQVMARALSLAPSKR